ncbi:hypothetical protein SLEP1_g34050 [Rubroshorea leprosula]|uniref:Uncharacterized protein n=1 Tax=Rubroshorea leprosula TaxID=152421 RepID=A0AAV5KIS6_9ROSI|nr:hypothetical protein SLEP1_g34050 [Rubroshorea leprosula]
MASFNSYILAFFMALALVFSSINVGLAARRLQQTPPSPSIPTEPQHTVPTLPTTQPTLP